jgi:SAM-dependent methyltransferase
MNKRPAYLDGNVRSWGLKADSYAHHAELAWNSDQPYWGIWRIPEAGVGLLPTDMAGLRCIELGCGTAYVSAWMHRRGADVVAIDPTPEQLDTARRLQASHGLDFTIEQAFAESVPYPDGSFDFAISEYGAALWADPYRWIPEAARLLCDGGRLVFLTNAPLAILCEPDFETDGPAGPALLRPYFDLYETRWPDCPEETEFHLPHGRMIDLLRDNGFEIERLIELQAPPGATTDFTNADPAWASRWPSEEAWIAKKRPSAR